MSMSTGKAVGKYTQYLRKKLKWSLAQLAQKSNLTSSFLVRLEKGHYETVKFDVIKSLAEAFDTQLGVFLYKCGLIENQELTELPSLEFYFKEEYSYPPEAIKDIKMFLEFIDKKYAQEIKAMKKAHDHYWQKLSKDS